MVILVAFLVAAFVAIMTWAVFSDPSGEDKVSNDAMWLAASSQLPKLCGRHPHTMAEAEETQAAIDRARMGLASVKDKAWRMAYSKALDIKQYRLDRSIKRIQQDDEIDRAVKFAPNLSDGR